MEETYPDMMDNVNRGHHAAVSIIMPVLNCQQFVAQAIESVLQQTFSNFEFIIIDDCSDDETLNIVKSFQDERIICISKPHRTGLVDSLNIGIKMAKCEYLARMDADDISHIERLDKQVGFLNDNPEITVCGTAFAVIDSNRIICHPTTHEDIKIALLEGCVIGHPTVMMRKSFLNQYNLQYDEAFECAEDYDLWTRCVWHGELANMPDVLLSYRLHNNQVSSQKNSNQVRNSLLCRVNMLKKIYGEASLDDTYTCELLFQNTNFDSINALDNVLQWVDGLISMNDSIKCFDSSKLREYMFNKKKNIVRRYFLNQTKYSPPVLLKFIKAKQWGSYFSGFEYVKLVMKCLVWWPGRLNLNS